MRILAVDDDPTILELLSIALSINGYDDVTTCESGPEAINLLGKGAVFDVFLLDIQMPGMDGIQLCHHIRTLPAHRSTPILIVTAMSDKKYVNSAFAAGANDFVNKPFDVIELGKRLQNNIEMSGGRSLVETANIAAHTPQPDEKVSDRNTLENYLKQLSRCAAPHAIVAFKISNVSVMQKSLTNAEFERMLNAFAKIIDHQMSGDTYLCGYVAHGTFLFIYQGSHHRFDGFLRTSLEDALNRHGWREETSTDNASLSMGSIVRCRKFREVDAELAIKHAIDSVQVATSHADRTVICSDALRAVG